jgi:hypothetical protein
MDRKILSLVVVAGLLLWAVTGTVFAGIEPVPWLPEINKLHSIELNIAAIQKRLGKLDGNESLPEGTVNYLNAMINQLGALDTRLADTLSLLDPFSQLDTAQEEVFLALDSISTDASPMTDIFSRIAERMGIEPSPWEPSPWELILDSIIRRIDQYLRTTDTLP